MSEEKPPFLRQQFREFCELGFMVEDKENDGYLLSDRFLSFFSFYLADLHDRRPEVPSETLIIVALQMTIQFMLNYKQLNNKPIEIDFEYLLVLFHYIKPEFLKQLISTW